MKYGNVPAAHAQLSRRAEEAHEEHSSILARLRDEACKSPLNYQELAVLQSKMEHCFLALISAWEEYYSRIDDVDDAEQLAPAIPSIS